VNLFAIASLLLLCIALGLSVYARRNAWRDPDTQWPFYAKRPFASPGQVLYHRLVTALPGHIVLSGMELSGVLGVKRGFEPGIWNQRIRRLRYDFVVCAKDSTVLAAIELDDKLGSNKDAETAVWMKERASEAAGIRVIRWPAKALPDHAAIQELFGELQMPFFEDAGSSANQSWWPSLTSAGRQSSEL
jgi:hypothetical protein